MEQEIQELHTSCKNCIFATFDGKVQTDCKLGRIAAFQKLDNLVEAEDDEKQFFIVNGRYCNAHQPQSGDFAKAFKPEDWVSTMKKMLALRLSILVVLEDGVDPQMLEPTCEAIKAQTLKPHQVIFVNNQSAVRPSEFHAKLFKQLSNEVTWRLNHVFEKGAEGKAVAPGRAIDHAMVGVTGSYYATIKPGFAPYADFVLDIHKALNEHMERFSVLLPKEDGNGLVVQSDLHRHSQINGNVPMFYETEDGKRVSLDTVVEKLQHYAELEERGYMIRKVVDICRNL